MILATWHLGAVAPGGGDIVPRVLQALLLAILLAFSVAAGPIINSPDIGPFSTFQDVATGRVWLDMNNFFNMSYNDMTAAAAAQGFTIATLSDVQELLGTLPLSGGEWVSYAAIMGAAPNRPLIWGAYLSTTTVNWAYAYSYDVAWNYDSNTGLSLSSVPNGGGPDADMNIWAYQQGEVIIPEPSPAALFALGFAALAIACRARRSRESH